MAYYLRRFTRLLTGHIDGPLLGAVLLLMGVGLTVLYSASNAGWARVSGQMVNMLVALMVMWIVANVPPHFLMRLALPLFILGVILLLGVAVKGDIVNGARRWLELGPVHLQISELAKFGLVFCLAHYLALNQTRIAEFTGRTCEPNRKPCRRGLRWADEGSKPCGRRRSNLACRTNLPRAVRRAVLRRHHQ